jgi:ribosome biogenesis SPOUT family RNA methylase Rps3
MTVLVPLDEIPYVDYPELRINKNESTEMPFRYVKGKDGESIMPDVSWQSLLRRGDADFSAGYD